MERRVVRLKLLETVPIVSAVVRVQKADWLLTAPKRGSVDSRWQSAFLIKLQA